VNAEQAVRAWVFNVVDVDELDVAEIAQGYGIGVDELTDAFNRVRITVSFWED